MAKRKTQGKRKKTKSSKKTKKASDSPKENDNEDKSILSVLSSLSPMFTSETPMETETPDDIEETDVYGDKQCHIDLAIGTKGDKTYEKMRKEGMPSFVRVHARWCGHCQELEPIWDELKEWHQKNVKNKKSPLDSLLLLSVEDTDLRSVQEKYPEMESKGYPTLMMVRNGKVMNEFQGPRSLPSLKTFLENQAQDMQKGGRRKRKSTRKRRRTKRRKRGHKSRKPRKSRHK